MIKTNKNSKILTFITMLILLPMLALSCFVQVLNKPKMVVSANTVIDNYTFEGSDLYLPFTLYDDSDNPIRNVDGSFKNIFLKFRIDLSKVVPNSVEFKYYYEGFFFNDNYAPTIGVETMKYYPCSGSGTFSRNHQGSVNLPFRFYDTNTMLWDYGHLKLYVFANEGDDTAFSSFNCNVYKYDLSSAYTESGTVFTGSNKLRYYDENENHIGISVFCLFDSSGKFQDYTGYFLPGLQLRTYYFSSALSDNTAYNSGVSDGYNIGFSAGSSSGYTDGFSAGKVEGYNNGYTAGVENSNNYSFLSLIGAVVDAPISAFTSLLNFNLLGVNLLAFFTGLLTLAIIIFIIKLVLGGK